MTAVLPDTVVPVRSRADRSTPDTAAFAAEVQPAPSAFARDVSYAVSIARSASTILHKRTVWAARREAQPAPARPGA